MATGNPVGFVYIWPSYIFVAGKVRTDASVSKRPRPCSEKAGLVSGNSDHGPRMGSEDDSSESEGGVATNAVSKSKAEVTIDPKTVSGFGSAVAGVGREYTRSMRSGLLRAVSIDESEPEKPEKTPPRLAIDSVVLFRDLFGFFIFRPAVAFPLERPPLSGDWRSDVGAPEYAVSRISGESTSPNIVLSPEVIGLRASSSMATCSSRRPLMFPYSFSLLKIMVSTAEAGESPLPTSLSNIFINS